MWHTLKHALAKRKLPPNSPYLELYNPHPDELVSFDCETTSLNVKEAHIISIGAVKIRGNQILTDESFYVLVKPDGIDDGDQRYHSWLTPQGFKRRTGHRDRHSAVFGICGWADAGGVFFRIRCGDGQ